MARYFFDHLVNGKLQTDDVGQDVVSPDQVRREAMQALPSIAKDELLKHGNQQTYTVLVRNEAGHPVYTATLSFAGLWLQHSQP